MVSAPPVNRPTTRYRCPSIRPAAGTRRNPGVPVALEDATAPPDEEPGDPLPSVALEEVALPDVALESVGSGSPLTRLPDGVPDADEDRATPASPSDGSVTHTPSWQRWSRLQSSVLLHWVTQSPLRQA